MIEEYADVCPTTSRGAARGPKKAPDSVRPGAAARRLGKTFYMAIRGGTVMPDAARVIGEHPLPISPTRDWFALFILCKAEAVQMPSLESLRNRMEMLIQWNCHRLQPPSACWPTLWS